LERHSIEPAELEIRSAGRKSYQRPGVGKNKSFHPVNTAESLEQPSSVVKLKVEE